MAEAENTTTSKSKNEVEKPITIGTNMDEKILKIESLKEIDEEVQYAIANHQSYLNPRSRESWLLYLILLVAFLNATSSGFDGSLMGSINAESQVRRFSPFTSQA
jgi:hypothetical protein